MVCDPSQLKIDCVSKCGASEYVQDVANKNWMNIKARLECLEAGENKPLSQEDTSWFVDSVTGSDDNPGTQAEPWATLKKGLDMLQSFTWVHDVVLQWNGAQTLPWDYSVVLNIDKGKSVTIDGGGELVVIQAAVVADISGQIDGNWRLIGKVGLGLTPNFAKGKMLKLGNIGGFPGALTGQKSTIIGNTADTYKVAEPFTGDPNGYDFEVVMPASSLEVNDPTIVPGTPDQFNKMAFGGIWLTHGFGQVYLQRCTFKGNIPVNVVTKDKVQFYLASCCLDKPQIPFFQNIWRLSFDFCDTIHGCISQVRDPSVLDGSVLLPLDKCGVGSVGGDNSIFNLYFDFFSEWSGGILKMEGSFFNRMTSNGSPGNSPRNSRYSHIDYLESGNSPSDFVGPHANCSFGGFLPFGVFFYIVPAVSNVDGSVIFSSNVHFLNSIDGVYCRRGKVRFQGTNIDGTNISRFGVNVIDTVSVYYQSGAAVALTGAAGDISLDGLVAVPGGHAAIIAGAPARDLVTACVARNQNLFAI